MLQDHVRRKEEPTKDFDLDAVQYSNDRVGSLVKNVREAIDWLFANLYTQYIGTYATPANLPATANANDYAYVTDDGDGKSAGYVYIVLDGVSSWQKKYDVDFNTDGLLSDLVNQTKPLYVFLNGRAGGQSLYGGTGITDTLELHGSADITKTAINIHDDLKPATDNERSLGSLTARLKDLFIAGTLQDGTVSLTLANLKLAYDHISLTNNPHSVSYDQLTTALGTLTVSGDVTGSVGLSTSGAKTLTTTVGADSHNHTSATITDFATAVYNKAKATILANDIISYTYDDVNQTIKPTVAVHTTSKLSDIDSPSTANKIVATDALGTKYTEKALNVELTGEVSGSGSYDVTTETASLATTVDSVGLEKVNEVNYKNLTAVISIGSLTVNVQAVNHQLKTNNKVHIISTETTPALNAEYTVTVVDADNFTIAETTTVGGSGFYIPNNAQLLYDTVTQKWITRREFAEISLSELSGLTEDVLTQYFNKNGRLGGQTAIGGTGASENLTLESTSDVTKGNIRFKDDIVPDSDAAYSAGWTGKNVGSSTNRIKDIHMVGQVRGMRLDAVASLPSPSTQTKWRVVVNEADEKVYIDNGVEFKQLSGSIPPAMLETFATVETKTVDMSSIVDDVNEWNWILLDETTNEIIHAEITYASTTQLTITVDYPLTGTYLIKAY